MLLIFTTVPAFRLPSVCKQQTVFFNARFPVREFSSGAAMERPKPQSVQFVCIIAKSACNNVSRENIILLVTEQPLPRSFLFFFFLLCWQHNPVFTCSLDTIPNDWRSHLSHPEMSMPTCLLWHVTWGCQMLMSSRHGMM